MITAIVSIVMFLVMIALHEFGHFTIGKILNFKIDEFSIGMGPCLWKKQKGETQYSLRALPLGGFCKFDGEDGDSVNPRSFARQKAWKKFLVLAAGGTVNILLGFILFLVIVPATSPMRTNIVDSVVEHSYIEQAGIQTGDRIVKLNGKNINFYNDISLYTQSFTKDEKAEIVVDRDGEKLAFSFQPTEQIISYTYTDEGVQVENSINGKATGEFVEYSEEVQKDDSLVGQTQTQTRYIIGFTPQLRDVTFFNVWGEAINQTKFVVKLVYQSLWQMITGKIGIDQMSGPVGIVSEVNSAVSSGSGSWLYVLNLMALLTINLGIFNLLPIPALDGGRILFVLWEMVTKKPVPPEKEGIVHGIGMLILMLFIVFVSFNDIMRLFQ